MRAAGFGVIDDHEIAAMLNGRDRLPPTRYPAEVIDGTVEPVGRFRPGYWFGRVGEAVVVGDRPSWWYVDRILLAAASALLSFSLLRRWMPSLLAVLPSLTLIAGPYSETWTRLGPSEAYAVPLLAAGVVVFVREIASRRSPPAVSGVAFLLLAAAGLAKENFLLVTGPLIVLGLCTPRVWKNTQLRLLALAGLLATVATGVGILVQVRRHGDVYQVSRSPEGAVDRFREIATTLDDVSGFLLVVGITALALLCCRSLVAVRNYGVSVVAGLAFLVLPQAWFYSGDVLAPRYYYPAAFFLPLVLAVSLSMLWARRRSIPVALALGVVVAIAGSHVWDQMKAVRNDAVAKSMFVADFGASIAEATALGRKEKTIVISTEDPVRYYEAIFSTNIFLRTRLGAGHPPILLRLPDNIPPATSPIAQELTDRLKHLSQQGGDGFVPYSPTSDCLTVVLGPENGSPCARAVAARGVP